MVLHGGVPVVPGDMFHGIDFYALYNTENQRAYVLIANVMPFSINFDQEPCCVCSSCLTTHCHCDMGS